MAILDEINRCCHWFYRRFSISLCPMQDVPISKIVMFPSIHSILSQLCIRWRQFNQRIVIHSRNEQSQTGLHSSRKNSIEKNKSFSQSLPL